MSKQYSAKLTLQDNWSTVISKAIKSTQTLEKEFKKIKDMKTNPQIKPEVDKKALNAFKSDMKKLQTSKIQVGAKMDASVASTLNAINSRIPDNKVIKVQAKDEVTKTVTNLERNLFTMQRRMDVGMKNPFKNMSVSATGAYRSVATLVGGMSTLSGLARVSGAGAAASMMAAGGGSAFVLGGMGRGKRGTSRSGNPMNTFAAIGKGAKEDVYYKAMAKAAGQVSDADILEELGVDKAWEANSNFAMMINNQKDKMASLGVANYLPQYQNVSKSIGTGGGSTSTDEDGHVDWEPDSVDFTGLGKKFSGVEKAFARVNATARRVGSEISSSMNRAFNAVKAAPLTRKTVSAFNSVKLQATIAGARVQFAFQRAFYGASAAFARIATVAGQAKSKVVTAFNKITGPIKAAFSKVVGPVKTVLGKIGSAIKTITNKVHQIRMKINQSPVMQGLKSMAGKMVSILKTAALAGAAAIAFAIKGAIGGAAQLETYQVSVAHNLDYADKKKNGGKSTKSPEQVKKEAAAYMASLKDYANNTPFETGDIYAAGNRAMGITDGDAGKAFDLVKSAGDMAALTPGKTSMDAMEALADLRMGETERMKEFGLKISAEDFAKAGGKSNMGDMNDTDMAKAYDTIMKTKVNQRFGGGAQDLAGTASGLFSTMKGKASSALTDVGTSFLPMMKGTLESIIGYIDSITPKVISFFKVLSGEEAASSPGMVKFMETMKTVGSVVDFVLKAVKTNFEATIPMIQTILTALTPTFEFVGELIGKVMKAVSGKIGVVGKVIGYLGEIWTSIWPTIQSVLETGWAIIEPIFNTLMDVASIIADLFMLVWPGIKGAIEGLWSGIKPVLDLFSAALEGISKFAGWVADKLSNVVDKKGEVDAADASTGGAPYSQRGGDSRAVGLAYVPYNGYSINAHRGEAVLTRPEADTWRDTRNGSQSNSSMNVSITVNGSDDPHMVAQKIYDKLMAIAPNVA